MLTRLLLAWQHELSESEQDITVRWDIFFLKQCHVYTSIPDMRHYHRQHNGQTQILNKTDQKYLARVVYSKEMSNTVSNHIHIQFR